MIKNNFSGPGAVKTIILQSVTIGPVLWLFEILQNAIYMIFTGNWGWIYPASPYHFFSFQSIPLWLTAVAVIFTVYRFLFLPRNMKFIYRIIITALIGFILEWTNGYTYNLMTSHHMFIWEKSAFLYIDFIAYPMWCINALIYEIMSPHIRYNKQ